MAIRNIAFALALKPAAAGLDFVRSVERGRRWPRGCLCKRFDSAGTPYPRCFYKSVCKPMTIRHMAFALALKRAAAAGLAGLRPSENARRRPSACLCKDSIVRAPPTPGFLQKSVQTHDNRAHGFRSGAETGGGCGAGRLATCGAFSSRLGTWVQDPGWTKRSGLGRRPEGAERCMQTHRGGTQLRLGCGRRD